MSRIKKATNLIKKNRFALPAILFLFGYVFLFIHLSGIPIGIYSFDNFIFIERGIDNTYTTLLKEIFFERLPSITTWNCHECRATYSLFSKLVYGIGGLDKNIFRGASALVGVLSALLVYGIVHAVSRNRIFAFLAGLFYITFPPYFAALWMYDDTEPLSQMLMLLSIFLFFYMIDIKKTKMPKIVIMLSFIIVSILAIKTKETAKILIPLYLLFSLVFSRKYFKYIIPFIALGLYISFSTQSGILMGSFSTDNMYRMGFASYKTMDTAPEIPPPFVSPLTNLRTTPASLFGSLGFFLGWVLIGSIIFLIFIFFKTKKYKDIHYIVLSNKIDPDTRAFLFVLVWFSMSVLISFFFPYTEHRYLGVYNATFSCFAFIVLSRSVELSRKKYKNLLIIMIVVLTILSLLVNSFHISSHIRGGTVSYHIGGYNAAKLAYTYENNRSFTDSEMTVLLNREYEQKQYDHIISLKGRIFSELFGFYFNGDIQDFKFGNWTRAYVVLKENVSGNLDIFNSDLYDSKLISETGGCYDDSIYCSLKNHIRPPKKTHQVYLVSKIQEGDFRE